MMIQIYSNLRPELPRHPESSLIREQNLPDIVEKMELLSHILGPEHEIVKVSLIDQVQPKFLFRAASEDWFVTAWDGDRYKTIGWCLSSFPSELATPIGYYFVTQHSSAVDSLESLKTIAEREISLVPDLAGRMDHLPVNYLNQDEICWAAKV